MVLGQTIASFGPIVMVLLLLSSLLSSSLLLLLLSVAVVSAFVERERESGPVAVHSFCAPLSLLLITIIIIIVIIIISVRQISSFVRSFEASQWNG